VIWAILAAIGVPLWLCAIGILALVFRNRNLRRRPGNIPVRVLRPGKKRWRSGHGIWVSDVFAWRGSPAAWIEDLQQVSEASPRPAGSDENKKLHRIGDDPVIASLTLADGRTLEVAARRERGRLLLGPFGDRSTPQPGALGEEPPVVGPLAAAERPLL
jgi:hypothetical protein